ncbi:hypothetical protein [Aquimarina sp. RZ0]|uniref:hypothetical protein n=1 Tax=Aquimarina sp. RZ0 TaxID=2607730 RepID=UPI00165EDEB8|nr:hypothetical protein [Aquimarina sp. RZ0]
MENLSIVLLEFRHRGDNSLSAIEYIMGYAARAAELCFSRYRLAEHLIIHEHS